jgi:hypothetical protein
MIMKIKEIITEEIKKYIFNESPDFGDGFAHSDSDAVAFGYIKKNGEIATGRVHYELFDYDKNNKITKYWRADLVYPGRIWTERKIISFWKYPETYQEMIKVVKDLENNLNIKIINNGYRVEIPPSEDPDRLVNDSGWRGKLIPLEDYAGGYKDAMSDVEHVASPMLKKQKDKPSYNKYAEIGLGKLTPAEYKAKKYKYVDEVISREIKNISEKYTPTKNTKNILSKEVSEEEIAAAEDILNSGVDKSWNVDSFGCMIIGVTGKNQVYYTFWKYSPKNKLSPLSYMGNLSTDIIKSAEKAKKIAGKQPIYFELYDTLKGLMGSSSDVVTFGKHRGKTLGEVYSEDPQYVIWISKNFIPKNKKQEEFLSIAKEFTDTYFRSMTEKNREDENKEGYGKVDDVFDGSLLVTKIDFFDGGYGASFRIRGETNKNRFQFYLTPKNIAKHFGITIKYDYIRSRGQVSEVISTDSMVAITNAINELNQKNIDIVGVVKEHKEIVGKQYTILQRVKLK